MQEMRTWASNEYLTQPTVLLNRFKILFLIYAMGKNKMRRSAFETIVINTQ